MTWTDNYKSNIVTAMIVCGIVATLSVSSAALSYTWKTVRDYRLERQAEAACRATLSEDLSDVESAAERWLMLRSCINEPLLGTQKFDTTEISDALKDIAGAIGDNRGKLKTDLVILKPLRRYRGFGWAHD